MSMLTGISLIIIGVWVLVQAAAGGLVVRLREATIDRRGA